MKKTSLCFLQILIVFVGGCAPLFPPGADLPPIPSETQQPSTLPATWTPLPIITITPTSIADFFPEGLQMVYMLDDTIYLWKEGEVTEILKQDSVSPASLSFDGKWLALNKKVQEDHPRHEIWAVGIDGDNLHRLLSLEEIAALSEDDSQLMIWNYDWMPKTHQLLFTTHRLIEGPPGYSPMFDLYLLDISGELRQLAAPGDGGDYFPSPDGLYVATSTTRRIALINLETGENQTLLEFDPLLIPTEAWHTPNLYWDRTSQHFTATIPPPDIYTPSDWPGGYAGGLEQIWRMHITGEVELLAEVKPAVGKPTVVSISPYAEYYFNMEWGTCGDGDFFISNLHTLPDGEELFTLPCWPDFPDWLPDGISYHYRSDEGWYLGNVSDPITHDISFVRQPTADNVWHDVSLEWIDTTSFISRKRISPDCDLYFGTVDGYLIPLFDQTDNCPQILFRIPTY
jgi:hypothetical protein